MANSDSNPKPKRPYRPHPPGYNTKEQIAARAARNLERAQKRQLALEAKEKARREKQEAREYQAQMRELEEGARIFAQELQAKLEVKNREASDPRRRVEQAEIDLRLAREAWMANPVSRRYNEGLNNDGETDSIQAKINRLRYMRLRREARRPVNRAKVALYRARQKLKEFEERQEYILACIRAGIEPKLSKE